MSLGEYFENTKGLGVLATSDAEGNVNTALYGRPHVMDENTVAFIMNERMSYANVQANPRAAFMFVEHTEGYKGKRLYLKKTKESDDQELIASMRRCEHGKKTGEPVQKHLVYFEIDRTRPLVGG
jgi:hypothetical protein